MKLQIFDIKLVFGRELRGAVESWLVFERDTRKLPPYTSQLSRLQKIAVLYLNKLYARNGKSVPNLLPY